MAARGIEKSTIALALGKLPRYKADVNAAADNDRFAVADLLTGVEIELEDWQEDGNNGDVDLSNYWTEHEEGSLRNGREFVLHPPRNGGKLATAIDQFFACGARWNPSERASVHVHLDMLNGATVAGFRAMFMLFYALEGAIYRVADENRKWASYSCPLIDMRADRLSAILAATTHAGFKRGLVGDYHEEKYYGFNSVSLSKHGTIELRYFPCTTNKATLLSWINLCQELYSAAIELDVPTLAQRIRDLGVEQFIRTHLPRSADDLLAYVDAQEVTQRVAECLAIYSDANVLKPIKYVANDANLKSAAYAKLFNKLCAPIAKRERLKKEMDVVEVNVDELYIALLNQAHNNNNNAGV